MNINKSPRRIDRKADGRNKKIIIKSYSKANYEEKKEYFMSLDWNLIWTILQVSALLIIAREIDKRIQKRKK